MGNLLTDAQLGRPHPKSQTQKGGLQNYKKWVRIRSAIRSAMASDFGRGERIRTSGLYVPNVALYQAKLHPDGFAEVSSDYSAAIAHHSIKPTATRPGCNITLSSISL